MQHDNNNNPAKILYIIRDDNNNVELDTTTGITFNFPHLVLFISFKY